MSTVQGTSHVTPTFRIPRARALMALGVLIALAAAIVLLALLGASRTTNTRPAAAGGTSTDSVHCVYVQQDKSCVTP